MIQPNDSSYKRNTSTNTSNSKFHDPTILPVLHTRQKNDSPKGTVDENIVLPSMLNPSHDNKSNWGGTDVKDDKPLSWKTSKKRSVSSTYETMSNTRNIIKNVLERSNESAK